VYVNTAIERIVPVNNKLMVYNTNHNELSANLVLVAVGAQPKNQLANEIQLP
jgi:hypothetical protein